MKKGSFYSAILLALFFFCSSAFAHFLPNASEGGGGEPATASFASIPMSTVVEVLAVAKDHYGVSLGALVSMYNAGTCTVDEYFDPDPAHGNVNDYIVTVGGSGLIVVLGEL